MEREQQERYLTLVAHFLGENWKVERRQEHQLYLFNGNLRVFCRFDG